MGIYLLVSENEVVQTHPSGIIALKCLLSSSFFLSVILRKFMCFTKIEEYYLITYKKIKLLFFNYNDDEGLSPEAIEQKKLLILVNVIIH